MGPKPSPNPGKTARYYRSNPKARAKHVRDNIKINNTPAKRKYRRDLMKIRRKVKPGAQQDVSHRGGKMTIESRKTNRARGGAQRK
jgi:hypothetical protein